MANGRRGPRQVKEWTAIPSINLGLTASGTSLGGSIGFNEPRTVLRMIGEYVMQGTGGQTFAESDSAKIALAIGVISSDAFAAGAGSVPDPAGEPEYSWLFWAEHEFLFPSATDDGNTAGSSLRRSFDIRSMRKMKPRESLAVVVEYADLTGAPPITVSIAQTRVLFGH